MQAEYEDIYEELYQKHWWWRVRERFILEFINIHKPKEKANQILDIGCGNGLIFDSVKKYGEIEGIEASRNIVNAAGHSRGKIRIGYAEDLLNESKRFDIILLLDVIEHIKDDLAILITAKKLLNKNGIVLITVPALNTLWTSHDDINLHFRRYNKANLTALIEKSGLSVSNIEYKFQLVAILKFAIAIKHRVWGNSHTTKELPNIPNKYFNDILQKVLLLENYLPKKLKLFGSSIFAIAKSAAD